jgi:Pentapeptide repeats (8 copies)
VLGLLWEQQQPRLLTHAGYEAICRHKGVKAVLAERAEEIYAEFVKQDRVNQFRTVFFNLVSLGDGTMGTTRRIASFTDIGESNWRDIVAPLSTSTNRLLRTDFDEKTKEATVEIIHESLIQYWQRLKNWIEEYRQELERIAKIKAAAMEWDKRNRSKQDLWQGKKLKDARKFSKDLDLVIPFPQIVNDFLVAGSRQQRGNLVGRCAALGMFVTVASWAYLIQFDLMVLFGIPPGQYDSRASRAVENLHFLKYPLSWVYFKNRTLPYVNLSGANLSGINFSDIDFRNANLSGANLSGANLSGANLSGANLSGANLFDANLRGANLTRANLSDAEITLTNLSGANLLDANLRDVNYIYAGSDPSAEQIKLAKNWYTAKYDPSLRKKLGFSHLIPIQKD